MPALKAYRASLGGVGKSDRSAAESSLMHAADAYIEKSTMFGDDEAAVVNLLHLSELGTSSYWMDMTSDVRSVEMRQAQSVSAYSKMMFASSHLPGLLSLVRETSAVEGLRTDEADAGSMVIRLYDSIEPASSPDRMSRLIDAVDMIYSACASLSDTKPDTLRLMSVTGVAVRSVVFHGDTQTINATRKVIAQLNQTAAEAHQHENYSVESIAAEIPLLDAIDELEYLDAMTPELAASAGRDAQQGAIMLLECGAQIVDHDMTSDGSYVPASVVAKLDADGKSFDNIDSRIGESIDVRYDEVYDREKEKLLNEPAPSITHKGNQKAPITSPGISARGERNASAQTVQVKQTGHRSDSIDELIIDLNRLYGEQRS